MENASATNTPASLAAPLTTISNKSLLLDDVYLEGGAGEFLLQLVSRYLGPAAHLGVAERGVYPLLRHLKGFAEALCLAPEVRHLPCRVLGLADELRYVLRHLSSWLSIPAVWKMSPAGDTKGGGGLALGIRTGA